MPTLENPAFGTPTIGVVSNRALPVRTLTYNRSAASEPLDERIERTTYSAAGFAASRIDPAGATPNFAYVVSLTGRALRTAGVDAGATIALADLDGRPLWSRDARGTVTTWTYDVLGRPLTVQEQSDTDTASATRDVFRYGEAEPDAQQHNLRGQCVRHYDTAGRLGVAGFSLAGAPLVESRQLLADAGQEPDWAGDDEAAWAAQLEATAYATAWDYDATGAWLTQTDALGNRQQRSFDVAGRLAGSRLTLAGGAMQPVLSAIDYSAAGQVLSETAGNGVVSAYAYEPETQRLAQLIVTRPAQRGRSVVLQSLSYTYDPVGNVLAVRDDAQPTTYWRNQKVEPEQTYTYDALYQLISATGRETASRGQQGAQLPSPLVPLPTDDSVYTNYTHAYAYDRGGNLTQIRHSAPASGNSYTTEITVSDRSNRAVLARDGLTPDQVDALFDAGGHQGALLPGQPLDWNRRGELRQVTPVRRDGQMDDREWYRYGSDGMRVLKISEQQSANTTQVQRVLYLPGLECRTSRTGETETESLQVIRMDTSGRAAVRVLHWASGKPMDLDNDALRYSYGDLIGSSLLELDAQAHICSLEAYYPYGGTAVWTARSAIEADYKTVRYSGKERDATGLYDYGFRYYQPWIGRWLSADPAGTVDGVNLYCMVNNNPCSSKDFYGLVKEHAIPNKIHHFWQGDLKNLSKHLGNLSKIADINSDHKVYLHVLLNDHSEMTELKERLSSRVRLKDATTEKWYKEFKTSERYKQFYASRTGERAHLASGADIIKTEIIYREGGIWNDVDNPPLKALPINLKNKDDQLLTAGPATFARWGGLKGVHSSTFASHKNNKLLKKMNDASYSKYSKISDIIYKKTQMTDDPDQHFKMISETAGSYHFSVELMKNSPEFNAALNSINSAGKKFDSDMIIFDQYFKPTTSTGPGGIDEDQVMVLAKNRFPKGHVFV